MSLKSLGVTELLKIVLYMEEIARTAVTKNCKFRQTVAVGVVKTCKVSYKSDKKSITNHKSDDKAN